MNCAKDWSDSYKINVPELDQEHESLFAQFNDFVRKLQDHAPRKEVTDTLTKLLEEVTVHFSHEEDVMKEIGYPSFESHKMIHTRLLGDAQEIVDDLKKSPENPDFLPYAKTLQSIVIDHIIDHDSKLQDFTTKKP